MYIAHHPLRQSEKKMDPNKAPPKPAARPDRSRSGGPSAVRLNTPQAASSLQANERPQVAASRRGDDVKGRILRAALECFGAFGFEGTSTRAVADRAGVTHTLVLYHFQSKEQLWKSMISDALSRYASDVQDSVQERSDRSASASLRQFIDKTVRMCAEHPQIYRIMTMEGSQDTDRLQWVIDTYLRQHFSTVKELIRRGQQEGTVRECDPARLYYLIIGAGGTPYTISTEYKALTGRDVFSDAEILRNIAFIYELVFV